MALNAVCTVQQAPRRRLFWATQPDACGWYTDCNTSCSVPGLVYQDSSEGRTISTDEWVRSLLLNILNTDAKMPATYCGYSPGRQGGHWSESYREDDLYTGSRVRFATAAVQNRGRVQDEISLLEAALQTDAQKLVQLGVASKVSVEVRYAGNGRAVAQVSVWGQGMTSNVNMTAQRLENQWVWA